MRMVLVFHGPKAEGLIGRVPDEIAANPPLTVEGMCKIRTLIPELKKWGPFARQIFSSRLHRALGTASILALEFNMEIQTVKGLGQHSSKEGNSFVTHPGYEGEGLLAWQKQGIEALETIFEMFPRAETILMVSHRPVIAGAVCAARGIFNEDAIRTMAEDPAFAARGFVVLEARESPDGTIVFTVVEQDS